MKAFSLVSIGLAAFLVGCDKSNPPSTATPPATGTAQNSATQQKPLDVGGQIVQAKKGSDAKIDTVALSSAIQQFNIGEGHYPKDLNELVQKQYIPKIPDPPYGYKIDYNATDGSVKVAPQ